MHSTHRSMYDGGEGLNDRVLEEDKKRRARRRHRKRIARIVVEHWQWIAREALRAVRFRRCFLMATALRGFKRNVSDRKLQWRSALMTHHKRLFRQSEECLVHWHQIVLDKKLKLESLAIHRRRVDLRRLASSFEGWRDVVQHKRSSRKRMVRAECYHAFARMSGCFQAWQVRAAELSLKRGMTLMALRHWSSTHQRKAFQTFAARKERKALQRARLVEAVAFWEAGLIRRGFAEWRTVTSLSVERRCLTLRLLELVKASILEKDMGYCFEGWQIVTLESRWESEQLRAADAWREEKLLTKALRRWVGSLLWKRRVSVFEQRLEGIGRRLRVAVALETWQAFASIVQTERALQIREGVLLGATFGTWSMYTSCRQRKRESANMARIHCRQRVRYQVLVHWKCQAHRLKNQRCQWDLAGLHCRKHVLKGVLATWKKRCNEWMEKNYLLWRSDQINTTRILRFSVDEWKRKVRASNLETLVEEHQLKSLKQRAMGALQMYANHKCTQEEKRRSAVRHWYLGRLARVMQAWRWHLSNRREKVLLMGRMAAHYHVHLLSSSFVVWRDEYCPDMRAFRDKIAKAALFWKINLVHRAIFGWQKVADELAEEKRRDNEARSLANFCLALKTIRTWGGVCRQKRIKRNRMEAKLRGVVEVLNSRKLEHAWDAWLELHRFRMIQAANMMEAAAHYEQGIRHRGFQAWLCYHKAKHEKNHRCHLVTSLRESLLTCKTLKAWKLGMERIAAGKRANSDAIKHWCRSMLGKSVCGWRFYLAGRKKKAALMSSALALHTQRLHQEGVTQWMHAANLKRGQRIKEQGQKTAVLLAEELALVAPYAQKWKRRVLHKRRSNGDAFSGHDALFRRSFCKHREGLEHRQIPIRQSTKRPQCRSRGREEYLQVQLSSERPKARCPPFLQAAVRQTVGLKSKEGPNYPTEIHSKSGAPIPKPLSPRRDILNSQLTKQTGPDKERAGNSSGAVLDSENQPPCGRKSWDACKVAAGNFPMASVGISETSTEWSDGVSLDKKRQGQSSGSEVVKGNSGNDQMGLEEALDCFSNSCDQVSECAAKIDALRRKLDCLGDGGEGNSARQMEADMLLLELSKWVKKQNALRETQAHYRTLVQRIIHSENG